MLYAAYGTLMDFPSFKNIPHIFSDGKYRNLIKLLGACCVDGWRFDYTASDNRPSTVSIPDIQEDPNESTWFVVYDIPVGLLDSISRSRSIYTGVSRFDRIEVDFLHEEALTIRFADPHRKGKAPLGLVSSMTKVALESGVDEAYVYNIIIGRSGMVKNDSDFIFGDTMYSHDLIKAGNLMREWYMQNVR